MSDTDPTRIVALSKADAERMLAVDLAAFFFDPVSADAEADMAHFDWDQTYGAMRGDALAGVNTTYDMDLTVPGPADTLTRIPMSGLSWVSVHPDHRRRGVLRAMMRQMLQRLHDEGRQAVSGLIAAEAGIYARFGYAVASVDMVLHAGRGTSFTAPAEIDAAATGVRTWFTAADSEKTTATLFEIQRRSAEGTLGMVTMSELMSRTVHKDRPERRRGEEPVQVLFAEVDGTVTGFALFNRKSQWEGMRPTGEVTVYEIAAVDQPSLLALARRLVDFDLTATVKIARRGLDDPLMWWGGGPRLVGGHVNDSLWLRLVDLDRALEQRGYGAPCDVVLDVVDELCPWNAGRWRFTVDEEGSARCERSEQGADLRLATQVLAGCYLGSRTVASYQATGEVEELTPGSVRALSRALAGVRQPVGSIMF
jgi:predicted acetyltransferase